MDSGATRRRVGLTVGLAALVGALLLRVAASDPVEMWHEPPRRGAPVLQAERTDDAIPTSMVPVDDNDEGGEEDAPQWLDDVIVGVFTVALAVAIVRLLRRRRRRLRIDFEFLAAGHHDLMDGRLPLVEATEASIELLTTSGTPRNAIVACWVRLEDAVEHAGLDRSPAETSTEFAERVLAAYQVDRATIDELAGLYREARFSVHELGEDHRRRAVAAFTDLAGQVRRPAHGHSEETV